jgi:hypothetical protein
LCSCVSKVPDRIVKANHTIHLSGCQTSRIRKVRKEREKEDEIVEAGFKTLAKKLHPDHGGVDEEMKELLRLREKMKNTWLRL